MAERIRALLEKLKAWWDKFTPRQKTLIVCAVAGVIVGLTILITAITAPKYTTLIVCDNTKQASEIKDLLDSNSMTYQISDDGLKIDILQEQLSSATLLLGANNYPTYGYDIENVFSGGFSTTESDKEKKYKIYLENQLEMDLTANESVDAASVTLNIPDNDGTLIANQQESYASVMLTLNQDMDADTAAALARFVATSLGNTSTENIVIMDSVGRMLFSGEDDASTSGSASNRLTYKQNYENLVKEQIKNALVQAKIYDNVQVVPNLDLDWSIMKRTQHDYTPAEGGTQGVLSHEDSYESQNAGGNGGVPGTDANGENTYVMEDNAYSNSSVTEESKDYLPNETITDTENPGGVIKYDTSSIGITAIHYVVYNEEELEASGELDGVTFDEFKTAHSERVKTEVDPEVVNVVARATGIPDGNIRIVAYDEPVFVDKEAKAVKAADVLQIILIVLILALLAFVVIRSMRGEKQPEEPEEELSLDTLLQSTQEAQELEDIEGEQKSDERLLIERFVDENPEAVANLLRNWLQEEW